MRNRLLPILLSVLLLLSSCGTETQESASESSDITSAIAEKEDTEVFLSQYPIGFWNYRFLEITTAEDVKLWAECGMSLALSPHFNYERETTENMLELLDTCHAYGIQVILVIEGIEYPNAEDEASFRSVFARAYEDFGSHPAVYAFAVGDEPRTDRDFKNLKTACTIMKEIAPELDPFVNFLPYYTGIEDEVYGGKAFDSSMKTVVEDCQLCYFSYDCYSQMHIGASDRGESVDGYFQSIRQYSHLAEITGCDWWNTVRLSGGGNTRVPDANDIRWQLTTSAASGARGVLWYHLYDFLDSRDYGSAIDEFGKTTPTYDALAHEMKVFHEQYGELLMELKLRAVYHVNYALGGYPLFPEKTHEHLIRLETDDGLPAMVSFFTDGEGEEYVAIVNNSFTYTDRFTLVLDKETTKAVTAVRQNGETLLDCLTDRTMAEVEENDGALLIHIWLNPGQMELFRFQ